MGTTPLFDIASDVKRTKQTKVAQIDGGIDGAPMRATEFFLALHSGCVLRLHPLK